MKVLVCGRRFWFDPARMARVLDQLPITTIINGGAPGTDAMASAYARAHGLTLIEVPADWDRYGRAAGPIRNQLMLDRHRPDLVVAFEGGKGTYDMIRRARNAGYKVWEIMDASDTISNYRADQ